MEECGAQHSREWLGGGGAGPRACPGLGRSGSLPASGAVAVGSVPGSPWGWLKAGKHGRVATGKGPRQPAVTPVVAAPAADHERLQRAPHHRPRRLRRGLWLPEGRHGQDVSTLEGREGPWGCPKGMGVHGRASGSQEPGDRVLNGQVSARGHMLASHSMPLSLSTFLPPEPPTHQHFSSPLSVSGCHKCIVGSRIPPKGSEVSPTLVLGPRAAWTLHYSASGPTHDPFPAGTP